ncbi:MAG TPA: zf-HC2 domain-containing protein [Gemmatales bacterium]|nr:zf-HC2 domain-containing protein [Gemmatales bacterium]HMP58698.1 zf-HC2 domain-containing protein [Gemmatales bacterium]
MTCTEVVALLPLDLYGDLEEAERSQVEKHLADCAACRSERAALARVREALGVCPTDLPQVEPGTILLAAERQARRTARRWRLVAGAAALLSVIALLLSVEVRLGPDQLVFRWGQPPAAPPPVLVAAGQNLSQADAERLTLVGDLIHVLADELDGLERRHGVEMHRLRQELARLGREQDRRWVETERDLRALYFAHFPPQTEGDRR